MLGAFPDLCALLFSPLNLQLMRWKVVSSDLHSHVGLLKSD